MGADDLDKFQENHPFGITLVARDNPVNRKLFPNGPFGYLDVEESSCAENGQCPFYQYTVDRDEELAKDVPIHMLVAAFRDKLCARTIHNAFTRAANPSRIFIRIIDQTQPGSDLVDDEGCWPRYCIEYNPKCEEFKDQVKSVRVDSANSRGPTWARSKLSAMVNWDYIHKDEPEEIVLKAVQKHDFCMQIDSHMDFADNYDNGLIAMHHRTENDYAVLSTYVADIEQNNKDPKTVPNLCMVEFTSSIRNWGTKECKGLRKPKLTNAMWGAGLSFHRCHGEINVPVDPYLDGVFDGEEGSRGIRFFTFGYDMYTPDKVLVTHDYHTHQSNPVVHTWGRGMRKKKGEADNEKNGGFEDSWKWMADIDANRDHWHTFGTKRVNMLLSIGSYFNSTKKEAEEVEKIRRCRYGLGTRRTLEQAIKFTGINLLEERMEENRCGNLHWIPFEEPMGYGVEDTLQRVLGADHVVLPSMEIPTIQQKVKPGPKMLRSMSNHDVQESTQVAGAVVPPPIESRSNFTVTGAIVIAALLVARLSISGYRRKEQRHND